MIFLRKLLKSVFADKQGGITTLVALSLPVVVGSVGLAFDLNRGYGQRVMNQRVADMAVLAAAIEYRADETTDINAVAANLALANGLNYATVRARLVASYPNDGDTSIKVTVTQGVPFILASVLGFSGNYNVSAEAAAIVNSEAPYGPPCFLALSGASDALEVNGGASIIAPNCSVAAVGNVNNWGTAIKASDIISGSGNIALGSGSLVADSLRYAGELEVPGWNTNLPPPKDRHNISTAFSDPWATSTELNSAISKIGQYANITSPGNPTTPGGVNWNLNYNPDSAVSAYRVGSTSEYVIPAGNYSIGKLTISGGITVKFQAGSTIRIANGVDNGGSSLNFGDTNVYINGGFNSGSSGVTFGSGTLWIGSGTISFSGTNKKGNGTVIINDAVTIGGGVKFDMGDGAHYLGSITLLGGGSTIVGDGDFTVKSGISIAGGAELIAGIGEKKIGRDSGGTSITIGGGSAFIMGSGEFSASGKVNTDGGGWLMFGAGTNHYIAGSLITRGAVYLGAGRYTIDGDFVNNTGGQTWPYTGKRNYVVYGSDGSGYGIAGFGVTIVSSGKLELGGGISAKLSAPKASVSGGAIAGLLFHSSSAQASSWTAGSKLVFDGVVHLPNATVSLGGGNSTADSGGCFMVIANKLKATGSATMGSACSLDIDGSGSGDESQRIKLVS